MYAQLKDESPTGSLTDTTNHLPPLPLSVAVDAPLSPPVPKGSSGVTKKNHGTGKALNQHSELRVSLMPTDDHERGDIEQGPHVYSNSGTANGDDEDPFYVFKEDLLIKLELMEEGLDFYTKIVHDTVRAVYNRIYVL